MSHQSFLDRIKQGKYPAFGALKWDGARRRIEEIVQFEGDTPEPLEVVKERAWRFFSLFTVEEWAKLDIEVCFKRKKPVRAIISGHTSELSAERLEELRRLSGLSK